MAGRPRTMVKRVARISERHRKLTEELTRLGRHHLPAEDQSWDVDVPGGDGDPIPALWRQVVFQAGFVNDYLDELLSFLEMKVERAEWATEADDLDALNDLEGADKGQPEPTDQADSDPEEPAKTSTAEMAERPGG